jgi:endoglucanase
LRILRSSLLVFILSVAAVAQVPVYPDQITDFVALHGQLAVDGTQLTDNQGKPIVLRGMSFGWHNWWPQFWNEQVVRWMRDDWRCTVLRAAMGIEHQSGYLLQPDSSKRLMKTVVDACIENGIYVIIDWHDHNAENHLEEARTFFTEMAEQYGDYPHVMYEIYNEPVRVDWQVVKAYSESLIVSIRRIDPDNIILIGNPHWGQDVHVVAENPISGYTNIMYTLHFYAATHKEWLRERGDYALGKGVPLFVTEYGGSEASGNGDLDMEEWDRWLNWMEKNQISWCKWSIADKQETCSVLKPGAAASGGWSLDDLKKSGLHTRTLLRKLNANAFLQE